jgi:hypothetical protein
MFVNLYYWNLPLPTLNISLISPYQPIYIYIYNMCLFMSTFLFEVLSISFFSLTHLHEYKKANQHVHLYVHLH